MTTSALTVDRSGRPSAQIEVVEAMTRSRHGYIRCAIGHDLVVKPDVLSAYCVRDLPTLVDDLVTLAGAAAFADRTVTRHSAQRWGRDIELNIPVHDPDFWLQQNVRDRLVDVLNYVSGDRWDLEFRKRRARTQSRPQGLFPFEPDPSTIVIPYSDGLDSFAVARLVSSRAPTAAVVLVTTGQRKDTDREWRRRVGGARHHRVSVPFELSGRRFREPSYRTRGFVFGIMAGVAAHLSGARTVVVPESGQGVLGSWMLPVGNEPPDVRTHPLFTRKLEALIEVVLGSSPRFEHPRLWYTKGETLRDLLAVDRAAPWACTRSCGRDARHVHLEGRLVPCGVCGACLLRRQSLLAAGLDEIQDRYLWRDLSAPTLNDAASRGVRQASVNDTKQAACGALSLAQLANLAAGGIEADHYTRDATEKLAPVLGDEPREIEAKLRKLTAKHRDEWRGLLASAGPDSFMAEWTEGPPC